MILIPEARQSLFMTLKNVIHESFGQKQKVKQTSIVVEETQFLLVWFFL